MKIIIVLALLVSVILTSTVMAGENLPLYNLSVSLDISKNLLNGVSTITIPENMVMNISTGDLRISSVKLNGLPFSPGIKDGIFKVKGRAYYHMSAFLPDGFTAISEADEITEMGFKGGRKLPTSVVEMNFPFEIFTEYFMSLI